mgnify:FL=1
MIIIICYVRSRYLCVSRRMTILTVLQQLVIVDRCDFFFFFLSIQDSVRICFYLLTYGINKIKRILWLRYTTVSCLSISFTTVLIVSVTWQLLHMKCLHFFLSLYILWLDSLLKNSKTSFIDFFRWYQFIGQRNSQDKFFFFFQPSEQDWPLNITHKCMYISSIDEDDVNIK